MLQIRTQRSVYSASHWYRFFEIFRKSFGKWQIRRTSRRMTILNTHYSVRLSIDRQKCIACTFRDVSSQYYYIRASSVSENTPLFNEKSLVLTIESGAYFSSKIIEKQTKQTIYDFRLHSNRLLNSSDLL